MPYVYPAQAGDADQQSGSPDSPYQVKGLGKSFCLPPAKVLRQEGRKTVMAELMGSENNEKGKAVCLSSQSPRG